MSLTDKARAGKKLNKYDPPTTEEIAMTVAYLVGSQSGPEYLDSLGEEKATGPEPYVRATIIIKNALKHNLIDIIDIIEK
jgi:hypothetical protein